jgi:hypothetical protein
MVWRRPPSGPAPPAHLPRNCRGRLSFPNERRRFDGFRAASASGPLSRPLPRKQRGREVTRAEPWERTRNRRRFGWSGAGPLRAGTTGPPPSKLPGEVVVSERAEALRWIPNCVREWPPLPASPPQTARERGDASRTFGANPSGHTRTQPVAAGSNSPPLPRSGEGAGGRGPRRAQFDACRRASHSRTPALPHSRTHALTHSRTFPQLLR